MHSLFVYVSSTYLTIIIIYIYHGNGIGCLFIFIYLLRVCRSYLLFIMIRMWTINSYWCPASSKKLSIQNRQLCCYLVCLVDYQCTFGWKHPHPNKHDAHPLRRLGLNAIIDIVDLSLFWSLLLIPILTYLFHQFVK